MALRYRARQFWNTLRSGLPAEELSQAKEFLPQPLMDLFNHMQNAEKSHSLKVFRRLIQEGEESPDLLTAALLHDVGKCLHPLSPWERALVVVAQSMLPSWAEKWGSFEPSGWKRPFAVAARHPEWGAELAKASGASPGAVRLILRHREKDPSGAIIEDELLKKLQRVDDES